MILGMGPMELAVIVVIVLVIFGPKNLPKLGSALGKTVKNVREGMEGDEAEKPAADEAEEVVADEDDADAEAEAVHCGQCGAANPAENKFCSKCGAKLGE